jgi:hypothetical protein
MTGCVSNCVEGRVKELSYCFQKKQIRIRKGGGTGMILTEERRRGMRD